MNSNNSSQPCNSFIRNKMNSKLFSRNIPLNKKNIILDPRPQFNMCFNKNNNQIIQEETNKICNNNQIIQEETNKICNNINCNSVFNSFSPGKGTFIEYSNNIDIESEIKNLNCSISCNNSYLPKCLTTDNYNNININNSLSCINNINNNNKICNDNIHLFPNCNPICSDRILFLKPTKRKIIA